MDKSLQRLLAAFADCPSAASGGASAPSLWLVDEQLGSSVPQPRPGMYALTNRADVYASLKQAGWAVSLNDFSIPAALAEFLGSEQALARVYYRVSKEKPLVHYLINQALAVLAPGGDLLLAGDKGDGIKTYAKKAADAVGAQADTDKDGDSWLCRIAMRQASAEPLADKDYAQLRQLSLKPLKGLDNIWQPKQVFSKPGIFGWDKLDLGSALLVQQLQAGDCLAGLSVLDIGCGYGYLSLAAQAMDAASVTATDNNVAAVNACRANLSGLENAVDEKAITVVLADCAAGITDRFDRVLCNPPFHQGFDMQGDLGRRFLQAAKQRLSTDGQAWFVVNEFLPLEKLAKADFSHCELKAQARGFKVFCLRP